MEGPSEARTSRRCPANPARCCRWNRSARFAWDAIFRRGGELDHQDFGAIDGCIASDVVARGHLPQNELASLCAEFDGDHAFVRTADPCVDELYETSISQTFKAFRNLKVPAR